MNVDTALRVARAICPRPSRERRFEEWRADAAGCAELGLSSAGLAIGALWLATEARLQVLLSLVARMLPGASTIAVGVVLGAICGAFGIPVLGVVAVALLLQASSVAVALCKLRAPRPRSHRIETGK